jgi:hypothetical protein
MYTSTSESALTKQPSARAIYICSKQSLIVEGTFGGEYLEWLDRRWTSRSLYLAPENFTCNHHHIPAGPWTFHFLYENLLKSYCLSRKTHPFFSVRNILRRLLWLHKIKKKFSIVIWIEIQATTDFFPPKHGNFHSKLRSKHEKRRGSASKSTPTIHHVTFRLDRNHWQNFDHIIASLSHFTKIFWLMLTRFQFGKCSRRTTRHFPGTSWSAGRLCQLRKLYGLPSSPSLHRSPSRASVAPPLQDLRLHGVYHHSQTRQPYPTCRWFRWILPSERISRCRDLLMTDRTCLIVDCWRSRRIWWWRNIGTLQKRENN